jgi:glucosyl-dolichyl phosphate glucuronosyltransferase
MRVTVAVCTWNRCHSLRRTLERMTELVIPPGVEWELLVVNNRSTDATEEVVASFAGRLPIRCLWEPKPGLSNARNRATEEATGDYIIWTDDDILVERQWLAAYVAMFREHPEAAVFGGPIEPIFEGTPPGWLLRVMDWIAPIFGHQSLGDEAVQLAPDLVHRGPYGGNMAMRLEAQRRFPYDPEMGVRHGEYATGEETQVILRMLSSGLDGWWSPEPRVGHWIPRSNQTPRFVRRCFVARGKGELRLGDRTAVRLAKRPYRLVRKALASELRYRIRRHLAPPEEWIMDLMTAGKLQGTILALAQLRSRRGRL